MSKDIIPLRSSCLNHFLMAGMEAKVPEGKQHARWGEKACVRKVVSELPSIVGSVCHFSIEDEGGLTAACSSFCKGLNALREIGIWRGMEDEALETSTASKKTIASLSSPHRPATSNCPDERLPIQEDVSGQIEIEMSYTYCRLGRCYLGLWNIR